MKHFGVEIFTKIPKLDELSFQPVISGSCDIVDLPNCLKIVEVMVSVLPSNFPRLRELIPVLLRYTTSHHTAARLLNIKSFAINLSELALKKKKCLTNFFEVTVDLFVK